MRTKQKIKSTLTLPEIIMYGLYCGQRAVCLLCSAIFVALPFEGESFCGDGEAVLFPAVHEGKTKMMGVRGKGKLRLLSLASLFSFDMDLQLD